MIYRDKLEIISDILGVASGGGITQTKIMYKAFLSYAQLKEYLTLLTENDLIRYDEDTQTFWTTEKGLRFLQIYNQIDGMIKEEQSQPQQQIWIYM